MALAEELRQWIRQLAGRSSVSRSWRSGWTTSGLMADEAS